MSANIENRSLVRSVVVGSLNLTMDNTYLSIKERHVTIYSYDFKHISNGKNPSDLRCSVL